MDDGYGIEAPHAHRGEPHRPPARYLIVIDADGSRVARLYVESREPVAEFDAGAEEVETMIRGLTPAQGASGSEWDRALGGHSDAERAEALVYTLPI
jgi:hypothetical protein